MKQFKRILLSCIALFCYAYLYSQDIIVTKEGDVIEAYNIFERGDFYYYSLSSKQDSIFRSINKDKLLMIKYVDGRKKYFNILESPQNEDSENPINTTKFDSMGNKYITARRERKASNANKTKVLVPYLDIQYKSYFYNAIIAEDFDVLTAPSLALRTQYISPIGNWFAEFLCGLQYSFGHERIDNEYNLDIKNCSVIEGIHFGPNIITNSGQRLSIYGGIGSRISLIWKIGDQDLQTAMVHGEWTRFIWLIEFGINLNIKKILIGAEFGRDINKTQREAKLRSFNICFSLGFEI